MDTGQGGVIAASRQYVTFTIARGEDVVTRHRRGREVREGVPGDFVTLNTEPKLADWALPYELTPTEARQLAAALVALADEIEIGDALSRAEIADMLRDEGYRTTERQIRYWVRLGHIPAPTDRKRPGHETHNAIYRRDQIPAIRAVAERYCRKEDR